MKVKHRISKVTSVISMITFFIVSAAQAQQNQQRDNIRGVPVAVPAPPSLPPPPPPTPINGNGLQDLAIKRVLPIYPSQARISELSGAVIVRVTINKEGNVSSAVPLTGDLMLKQEAMRASYGWKWDPTLIQDAPHGISGNIRFDFDEDGTVSINTSIDPAVVDEKEVYKAELLRKLDRHLEQLRAAPSPALYNEVGQGYFSLSRIQEAIETYKEGISRFPREIALYMAWAGIYMKQGMSGNHGEKNQQEEMVKVLELAAQIKIEPDSPIHIREQSSVLLWFLGFNYLAMDRYVEAKETLERALSLNPSEKYRSQLYISLGQASVKLGDKKLAISMAEKLLELRDKDSAMSLLIELYKKLVELGDKKSAKAVMVLADKVCRMTVFIPITR